MAKVAPNLSHASRANACTLSLVAARMMPCATERVESKLRAKSHCACTDMLSDSDDEVVEKKYGDSRGRWNPTESALKSIISVPLLASTFSF